MSDAGRQRSALTDRIPGQRVVLTVYAIVVAIAGAMGALLGAVAPEGMDPELFFVIDLPATVLGMATYGAVTVGTVLGVALALVRVVSRYDSHRIE